MAVYYDNTLNAGLAIFTLIGSQLLGYGYAGLLQDLLVKPTKCFWPTTSAYATLAVVDPPLTSPPQSRRPTCSRHSTMTTR